MNPDERALGAARAEGRRRLRAGIYTRMSIAAIGDTTKTDDQEYISRQLAERRGDTDVVDVYTDNNKSAWQPNRKRKGWDRMLADVDSGRLDALIVYHGDRLIRQPWDLETLIQRAESKGIRIFSPTGTRDLDNADDRFILRIEAAQACRESDNTSRRRKAQYERWRREGRVRPGGRGGRAFGFATDGVTLVPGECDLVREMAGRVLRGESVGAIARDVSARGWRTPAGGEFTHGTVRKMLGRPRYAGLMPDGESRAAWPAVLDRETWERARLVLGARAAGFGYATNARRWLLSGIAVCGAPAGADGAVCGSPLQVKPSKGRGRKEYASGYACTRKGCGKVYRSAPLLDAYVSAAVIANLGNPLNPRGRAMPVDRAAEWATLERERGETEAMARRYAESAGRLAMLMGRLDEIDERMAELRALAAGDSRARMLERYAGVTREQWEGDLTLDVKRALVSACFRVVVLPASGRGPGFRAQDVRLEPAVHSW